MFLLWPNVQKLNERRKITRETHTKKKKRIASKWHHHRSSHCNIVLHTATLNYYSDKRSTRNNVYLCVLFSHSIECAFFVSVGPNLVDLHTFSAESTMFVVVFFFPFRMYWSKAMWFPILYAHKHKLRAFWQIFERTNSSSSSSRSQNKIRAVDKFANEMERSKLWSMMMKQKRKRQTRECLLLLHSYYRIEPSKCHETN